MRNEDSVWAVMLIMLLAIGVLSLWYILIVKPLPYAHIDKIDKDGTVWIQLSNMDVSDNITICVYYGDNVSSKQMWILK